jgi:hypothetical protein
MKTAIVALLIALIIALFAIWKMQNIDDVDVRLEKTGVEVRARGSNGSVSLAKEVVTIGPYVSSLTDATLAQIRDRVNGCRPERVQDVFSYYHQNPGPGGEYAILLLCIPAKDATKAITFQARQISKVHLDLPNEEQNLKAYPDRVVVVLTYEGGNNEIAWLERKDSNVMNTTALP